MVEAPPDYPPFLGSELSPAAPEQARFHVLPVPWERSVSYGGGTANGPAAILKASWQLEAWDGGEVPGASGIFTHPPLDVRGGAEAVLDRIAAAVAAILAMGAVPVVVGGEHSTTYGAVRGMLAAEVGSFGVVQLDAHADLRDSYQGDRLSHACVMRRIVEAGIPLYQLGVRAMCAEEARARARYGIRFLDADRLVPRGIAEVELPADFPEQIYVTLDVDGLDPTVFPATGAPVPGGPGWYQTLGLLESVVRQRRLIGFDLMELAPISGLHCCEFAAAQLVYKLMAIQQRIGRVSAPRTAGGRMRSHAILDRSSAHSRHRGETMTDAAQTPELVTFRGEQMSLDQLLEEHGRLRAELAQNKQENRKAVTRRRQEQSLKPFQAELICLQKYLEETKSRMIILFEGRDAAGKGGTIRRVTRYMNEKHYRVVAMGRPTEEQRTQWFFQKYVAQFPRGGEIVLFDRSWYNRAIVEPIFGFCDELEYENFMHGVVGFEKDLVRQGTKLVKLYFSVTKDEQERRFERRKTDPLRQWKLSEIDVQAQDRWDDFTRQKHEMLKRSHTAQAPWTVIRSNNKFRARLNAMKVILNAVPYERKNRDLDYVPDPEIVISGARELEIMEAQMLREGKFTG